MKKGFYIEYFEAGNWKKINDEPFRTSLHAKAQSRANLYPLPQRIVYVANKQLNPIILER